MDGSKQIIHKSESTSNEQLLASTRNAKDIYKSITKNACYLLVKYYDRDKF